MTTTREMPRDTVRAARMKRELLTTRVPSCAAALVAVSVTAREYGLGASLRRYQQEDLSLVERRVVLVQVVDCVRELRVGDVVGATERDARVVEPDARLVVADDRHEVRD